MASEKVPKLEVRDVDRAAAEEIERFRYEPSLGEKDIGCIIARHMAPERAEADAHSWERQRLHDEHVALLNEAAKLRALLDEAVACFDATPRLATEFDCPDHAQCAGCRWRRWRADCDALRPADKTEGDEGVECIHNNAVGECCDEAMPGERS